MSLTIASLATATEFSLRPEWSGSSAFANGAKAPAAPAPQTTVSEVARTELHANREDCDASTLFFCFCFGIFTFFLVVLR